MKYYFDRIEKVMRALIERRRLEKVLLKGNLSATCKELYDSSTVIILTGFYISNANAAENDGPLGTASLANALEKIGKTVVILTDNNCSEVVATCMKSMEVKAKLEVVPSTGEAKFYSDLLNKYKPTHIVSIERPGRAVDNECYNMNGIKLTGYVADCDNLFLMAQEQGIVTIAVGDGGNEIGMGNIENDIKRYVKNGEKICAKSTCDYLIVAGTSNWGAYAIVSGLSLLSNKNIFHDYYTEIKMLEKVISVGGVDGYTGKPSMTVDGIKLSYNVRQVVNFNLIVESYLSLNRNNVI
ncbi:DUF4392 domain-containing protein [Clostridium bowmanii]|uniref:DUF4392 domain-containing protein n=1 Tax=Clostridium bowmanii TaxID=132925 RepID=UPI001C0D18BC|nr:DUF4392 domain-containing protein [Clostridium bowmanii]MBU3189990.1 DUF4392 domain-containing protein [Clostridium bowmanii]MCA1074576.1 DUF4392 domain-containing protein [Clostridium bowmanii]